MLLIPVPTGTSFNSSARRKASLYIKALVPENSPGVKCPMINATSII